MIAHVSNLISSFIHPVLNVVIGTFAGAFIAYRLSEKRDREARIELQNREYLLPTVVRPLVGALREERQSASTLSIFEIERVLSTFESIYYLSSAPRQQLEDYVQFGYKYLRATAELDRDVVTRCEELLKQRQIPFMTEGVSFNNVSVTLSWLDSERDIKQFLPEVAPNCSGTGYGLLGGSAPTQVFYVDPATVQDHLDDLRLIARDLREEFRDDPRWQDLLTIRTQQRVRNQELERLLGRV